VGSPVVNNTIDGPTFSYKTVEVDGKWVPASVQNVTKAAADQNVQADKLPYRTQQRKAFVRDSSFKKWNVEATAQNTIDVQSTKVMQDCAEFFKNQDCSKDPAGVGGDGGGPRTLPRVKSGLPGWRWSSLRNETLTAQLGPTYKDTL
jgi:hypothetical protein